MNVSLYDRKDECCGCEACSQICPKSAINMIADKEGYLYPIIDNSKCVRCLKCLRACPFKNTN